MTYRFTKENGSVVTEANPNWVKINPTYPSFICCGETDAECVILSDGEEQTQYNIGYARYPQFGVVNYTRS